MLQIKRGPSIVGGAIENAWRNRRPPVVYLIMLAWFAFLIFFFRCSGVFAVWQRLEGDLALFSVVKDPFPWYLLAQLLQGASLIMTVIVLAAGIYFCQNQYFLQLQAQTEELRQRKEAGQTNGELQVMQLLGTTLSLLPLAAGGLIIGNFLASVSFWQLHQYLVLQDALNTYAPRPLFEVLLLLVGVGGVLLLDHFSGRKLLMVITSRQSVATEDEWKDV